MMYNYVAHKDVVLTREADGEHGEMSLQARVDGERAGGGVHARHVLCLGDFLQRQLRPVVPVVVVEVLANERVRLHGEVLVDFGHVHVVDEVDETSCTRRPEVTTSFFL